MVAPVDAAPRPAPTGDSVRMYFQDIHYSRSAPRADHAATRITHPATLLGEWHAPLAVARARLYRAQAAAVGLSLAEVISTANLGLMAAAHGFDPDRGFCFSSYGAVCIDRAIQYQISQAQREQRPSLDLDVALATGAEPVDDETPDLLVARRELQAALRDEIAKIHLSDRERAILQARFPPLGGPPRTLAQLGKDLGCSREAVRKMEAKILGKLKESRRLLELWQAWTDVGGA